jgi:FAD/FMN-containing dehydrogenase
MTISTATTLRATLDGVVLTPDDPGYDDAKQVLPGGFDLRPAAIARPTDAAGVATVVRAAHEAGVPLAVRSGGHSAPGFGIVDDGVVLDVRGLNRIDLDADGRTAWAGGGITAGAYTAAVVERGLVTPFGDTGSVGVGGITLGGGVGFLVRKHGLTVDSLLAAEVVTADGEVLVADADHHADLFWALRGGGGNFGVVTRFQFRLHELPSIVGGLLVLPGTGDVVAGLLEVLDAAPRELSAIVNVMPAPPMPFLPAEWHGRLIAMVGVCWAGPADAADAALAPLRALAEPLADLVRPGPYTSMFEPMPEGFHPFNTLNTFYTDGVDAATAAHAVDQLASSDAMMRAMQLRVLGGAVTDVPDDATAYAHRAERVMGNVAAIEATADAAQRHVGWVGDLADRLSGGRGAVYVNFLADTARARDAYPGTTWDRLAAVKRRYDPDNLFRSNHNVPPAAG